MLPSASNYLEFPTTPTEGAMKFSEGSKFDRLDIIARPKHFFSLLDLCLGQRGEAIDQNNVGSVRCESPPPDVERLVYILAHLEKDT
jgi:hypothetical protein